MPYDFRKSVGATYYQKLRFKNPADAKHMFEGMRKAGLPE
jgi:hypothetical protein